MEGERQRSLPETRSAQDIALAHETLLFVEGIPEARRSPYDLRSLVLNLCDFQYRFSIPMPLPFGLGKDFPAKLATPRPFALLRDLNLVVPVTAAPADPEKHDSVMSPEGVAHVFEGSQMWRETTGREPSAELRLSAFRWLKDLFVVLEGERERPEARRLGACWYYTASEANFDEDSESAELHSGEEEEAGMAVTGTLLGILGGPEAEEYNEDEDEDFVPPASASVSESFESDAEAAPGPMDESSPEFKVPEAPFRRPKPESEEEEEEEDDEEEGEEDEDVEMDSEKARELQQAEEDIRSSVLASVERLHCFMPSPASHMQWFKRMLIKMQPGAAVGEWFPWGVPPVQRVLDDIMALEGGGKMTAEQDAASDFLREILQPFAEMQAQPDMPSPQQADSN